MIFALAAAVLGFLAPMDEPDVRPDTLDTKVRVTVKEASAGEATASRVGVKRQAPRIPKGCFVDMSNPNYRCALQDFPEGTPADADLSPGDIATAAREVGMPPLKLHIQPGGGTLVNIDTIFYTNPTRLRRTVALLGHEVRLDARPVRFTWVHGDGTQASTARAGRPYPAMDVTHQYQQLGDNLRARVDTTYRVRYSVDGGEWNELGQTLTARGPATSLDVDEAAPVLTD